MSLRAKLLLGLGLILIFLVALSGLAYRAVLVNRNASDSAVHTEEVLELATDATSTVSDVELRYLQFLLTGSEVRNESPGWVFHPKEKNDGRHLLRFERQD